VPFFPFFFFLSFFKKSIDVLNKIGTLNILCWFLISEGRVLVVNYWEFFLTCVYEVVSKIRLNKNKNVFHERKRKKKKTEREELRMPVMG
jgi:hypothetical protein